uniref:Terpene synthase metal-binding domain-containing protein n=1 Tax=Salix viminalis TaxID=40686 RepID=A0A6N2KG92_SALVM
MLDRLHKGARIEARNTFFLRRNEFQSSSVTAQTRAIHSVEYFFVQVRVWNDLNFAEELPYARDRIVEIYFSMNGIHFELNMLSLDDDSKYTNLYHGR